MKSKEKIQSEIDSKMKDIMRLAIDIQNIAHHDSVRAKKSKLEGFGIDIWAFADKKRHELSKAFKQKQA